MKHNTAFESAPAFGLRWTVCSNAANGLSTLRYASPRLGPGRRALNLGLQLKEIEYGKRVQERTTRIYEWAPCLIGSDSIILGQCTDVTGKIRRGAAQALRVGLNCFRPQTG